MMDGETVCVRYRDPDRNRQMDFYTVRAEVYVDLRNLSERYSWKDEQRIGNRLLPAFLTPKVGSSKDWRRERMGIATVEPNASKTIEGAPSHGSPSPPAPTFVASSNDLTPVCRPTFHRKTCAPSGTR